MQSGKGITCLSVFDGISCGRIALERANIKINTYYASEVEPHAEGISEYNYPDIIRLGSVENYKEWDLTKIDLLIGGSPCQDLSIAKANREGLSGEKSRLFWKYVECLEKFKPKYFLLENNNSMSKEDKDTITQVLGVEPIMINSDLVSSQLRKRLYWTNIPNVELPKNKGILLENIIESGMVDRKKSLCLSRRYAGFSGSQDYLRHRYFGKSFGQAIFEGNATPQTHKDFYKKHGRHPNIKNNIDGQIRQMTHIECERLQTLPNKVFYVIIDLKELLCLDQAKNFVNAVEKNHKLLKLVLSAGKKELKEYVNIAIQSMSVSRQSKKYIAQKSVDTQTPKQTKECTSYKQTELSTSANNVENGVLYQSQETEVGSVAVNVPMNLIEGRIAHNGKAESLLKDNNSLNQKNGKNVQKLYLKEIMELAENVGLGIAKKIEKSSIYTTSYHLSTQNIEQILTILYCFAKNVIDGCIAKRIQIKSLYLSLTDGYTKYEKRNNLIIETPKGMRYEVIGNGWTVDVIAHIFKGLKE